MMNPVGSALTNDAGTPWPVDPKARVPRRFSTMKLLGKSTLSATLNAPGRRAELSVGRDEPGEVVGRWPCCFAPRQYPNQPAVERFGRIPRILRGAPSTRGVRQLRANFSRRATSAEARSSLSYWPSCCKHADTPSAEQGVSASRSATAPAARCRLGRVVTGLNAW